MRQKRCPPKRSDVIPTIENVIKTPPAANVTTVNVNTPHTNTNIHNTTNHITNNNVTNNNVTNNNVTNNININIIPYNREDTSHITDAQWQSLVNMGSTGNMQHTIASLVTLINYNPNKPENMNVYMSPLELSPPEDALVFQRQTGDPTPCWRRVKTDTVVAWLMSDRASNMYEWTADNRGKVEPHEAAAVEEFFDFINGGCNTEVRHSLADMVQRAATCGSQVMLVMRGGCPPTPGGHS